MEFPDRELEVVRLAQTMSRGLTANPELFPAPPSQAEAIDEAIAAYNAAVESSVAGRAAAKAGSVAKRNALDALSGMLKSNIKYAQSMANGDDGVLERVGWGGPRKPVRNERIVPGQVITLEVGQEGAGWVALAWKPPFDGGTVAAYRIQRRKRDSGDWVDVGTAIDTTVKLNGQDAGVELEYRVIGVNAAGEGPVSNIVRVVL